MNALNFISAPEITKVHVVLSDKMTPISAYLDPKKAQEARHGSLPYPVPLEDFDITSPEFWQILLGEIPEIQDAIAEGYSIFDRLKNGKWEDINLDSIPERCSIYVVCDRADHPLKAFISQSEAYRLIDRNPEFTAYTVLLEDFDYWSPSFYGTLINESQKLQETVTKGFEFLDNFNPFSRRDK